MPGDIVAERAMRFAVRARLEEVYHLVAEVSGQLADLRSRVDVRHVDEQLAELAALLDHVDGPSCRICGCTQGMACADGCWWVAPDLCSSCDPALDSDETAGPPPSPTLSRNRNADGAGPGPSSEADLDALPLIALEPTGDFFAVGPPVNGGPILARQWRGATAEGGSVVAWIVALGVDDQAVDLARFERVLHPVQAPVADGDAH